MSTLITSDVGIVRAPKVSGLKKPRPLRRQLSSPEQQTGDHLLFSSALSLANLNQFGKIVDVSPKIKKCFARFRSKS